MLATRKMELEEKACDLVLKRLCYDVEVWRAHTQKCTDYGMAVRSALRELVGTAMESFGGTLTDRWLSVG